MDPLREQTLGWIDRLLDLVKALRERAEALTEKAEDWEARLRSFAKAYALFHQQRDTMEVLTPRLKDYGCTDEATLIRISYEKLDRPTLFWDERNLPLLHLPGRFQFLLVLTRELEQDLLKVRKKVSSDVQERPADEQGGPWSKPDSPSRWAKVFKMSTRTFIRHVKKEAIHAKKLSDKSYQVALSDIPKPQASPPS